MSLKKTIASSYSLSPNEYILFNTTADIKIHYLYNDRYEKGLKCILVDIELQSSFVQEIKPEHYLYGPNNSP